MNKLDRFCLVHERLQEKIDDILKSRIGEIDRRLVYNPYGRQFVVYLPHKTLSFKSWEYNSNGSITFYWESWARGCMVDSGSYAIRTDYIIDENAHAIAVNLIDAAEAQRKREEEETKAVISREKELAQIERERAELKRLLAKHNAGEI